MRVDTRKRLVPGSDVAAYGKSVSVSAKQAKRCDPEMRRPG